jgi:uncharacterized protein
MFRPMRRKKQVLTRAECEAILNRGTSGVLALAGDDDYPYAVPLSYVFDGGKIYFHTAKSGHKLDSIARNARVSFCVIDLDRVIPEEYTTYFRSAIAFGRVRILDNAPEKRSALEKLAARYSPDQVEGRRQEIDKSFDQVVMLELTIDHLTGKEAIELVKEKKPE